MQIDAIDGYIFGPNDLSGSIGELLQVFDEKTTSLIKEAICKLKSKNKYIGLATGDMRAEVLKYWSEMGIDMLFAGADYSFIVDGGKRLLNTLKENHVKNQTK
jgi:2-dehydro-3-deoxyglucarate aldolase/4-hydroxy-2-oxoheptanedioate aldolase